jgi:hypothetical protein
LATFVGGIAVLLAALAVGMAVRTFRAQDQTPVWKLGPVRPLDRTSADGSAVAVKDTTPGAGTRTDEIAQQVGDANEPDAGVDQAHEPNDANEPQPPVKVAQGTDATAPPQKQTAQSVPGWRQVWADLKLTDAEQARLRQGVTLLIQRWQRMSPADQQAQMQRFSAMRQQWESMPDDQKQQTSQRLRDRFENWRRSDQVELPELSLD